MASRSSGCLWDHVGASDVVQGVEVLLACWATRCPQFVSRLGRQQPGNVVHAVTVYGVVPSTSGIPDGVVPTPTAAVNMTDADRDRLLLGGDSVTFRRAPRWPTPCGPHRGRTAT